MTGLRLRPLALAAALLGGLAACGGEGRVGGPGPVEPPPQGALRIELTPPAPAGGTDFVVGARLVLASGEPALAAFAAEIAFDPSRFQMLSSDGLGPGRVVNTAGTSQGQLVATGASLAGFPDGLLFRGTFRATGPAPSPSDFQLTVHEALDVQLRDVQGASP